MKVFVKVCLAQQKPSRDFEANCDSSDSCEGFTVDKRQQTNMPLSIL